jgi:hypothetical protein
VVRDAAVLGASREPINIFQSGSRRDLRWSYLAGPGLFEPLQRDSAPSLPACREGLPDRPGYPPGTAGVFGAARAYLEQVEAGIVTC